MVVILEKTLLFQAFRVSLINVMIEVSGGICELTLVQACSVGMKETPTLELMTVSLLLKKNIAATRDSDSALSPVWFHFPTKVLYCGGL